MNLPTAQARPNNSQSGLATPLVNGTCPATTTRSLTNCTASTGCPEEESEDGTTTPPLPAGDLLVLSVDRTRQRMICYIAVLHATNREAAGCYYALMSQVEQTIGVPGWLEGLEEIILEEVALLYTLGASHPAFSFEQRIMLSEILSKVRNQLYKHKVTRNFGYNYPVPVRIYNFELYCYFYYDLGTSFSRRSAGSLRLGSNLLVDRLL